MFVHSSYHWKIFFKVKVNCGKTENKMLGLLHDLKSRTRRHSKKNKCRNLATLNDKAAIVLKVQQNKFPYFIMITLRILRLLNCGFPKLGLRKT